MFYQVKVLDQQGKVKKVISSKRLSNKYWKRNNEGKEFTGSMGIEDGEFDESAIFYSHASENPECRPTLPTN